MNLSFENKDRLGYYLVGWKKFYSKTLALIESNKTGYDAIWIFNDNVYDSINWTTPIETPLLELYKRRAQQIRDKYDYVVIYYSGGCDSGNALHSFLDNNIFVDEIIVQDLDIVKTKLDSKDLSNQNFYSELEFAANAHLRKVKNLIHPNTKITHQDFSKSSIELLEKDYWLDSSSVNFSINISCVLRQISQERDEFNLKLFDKGKKCAYVLGIDKPLVYNDGHNYFSYFTDANTYHYMSPVEFNDKLGQSTTFTEFFYWTPEMPEIVVKQAQELKKFYETNPHMKYMAQEVMKRHISEYRPIVHPLVYPAHVFEPFQVEKPPIALYRPMDAWFWETTSKRTQDNYTQGIRELGQSMNCKDFIQGNIEFGFYAHRSKMYRL